MKLGTLFGAALALALAACETAPSQPLILGAPGGNPAPPARETQEQTDRAVILEIQQRLNAAGYPAGPEDGLNGPRTRAAIRAWQVDHGLFADGEPDRDLLERLRAAAGDRAGT